MDPRCDHRRRRVREQRAPRHPCRQPTRTRAVLRGLRRARTAGQHRQVRIPRSPGRGDIRRLGPASRASRSPSCAPPAGRDPYNRDLSDLVGELATQSEAFRTRWATHKVRLHNAGVKHFCHPVVGDLHLTYNRLDLAADPGPTPVHLHSRARLALRRNTEAPRQLGSHRRRHRSDARDRRKLRRSAIRSRTPQSGAPAPCSATAASGPAFTSGRSFSPYSSPPPNARQARPPGRVAAPNELPATAEAPYPRERVPQLKRSTAIAHAMQVHDDRRRRRLVSRHGSLSCSVAMCPRVPCGPLWQWLYRDANAGRLVVGGRDSRRQRARLR